MIYIEMPRAVSGVTVPPNGKVKDYIVGINPLHSHTHQRFTVAHELSHIYLRHTRRGNGLTLYVEIEKFYLDIYPLEREANIFASELLMPTHHLKSLVMDSGLRDIDNLRRLYDVSRATMKIKLEEIGLPS